MSLSTLSHILDIVLAPTVNRSEEERQELVNEALLLVLSRATGADTNIHPVEVETVRSMIKDRTGEDVSAKDVRMAAHSRIYEQAPLRVHLAKVTELLGTEDRVMIVKALADVVKSDGRVTNREVTFFNDITRALDVSAAEIAGLVVTD